MVGNCQSDCLPRPNGDDEDDNGDASDDDNDDVWLMVVPMVQDGDGK